MKTDYKFGEVKRLLEQIEIGKEKVNFRDIFETGNGGISLLAFERGLRLDKHLSPAQLMVYVLEGEIEFTMIDKPHILVADEFILVGKDVPHSVSAIQDSKVLLIKVQP